MTHQNETIEAMQKSLEHLRGIGLLPAEEPTRKALSPEEREAREEALESAESEWRDATARIQVGIDEAQKTYDLARGKMNAANDELQQLRAELTRLTADHVEKRDAIRRELAQ